MRTRSPRPPSAAATPARREPTTPGSPSASGASGASGSSSSPGASTSPAGRRRRLGLRSRVAAASATIALLLSTTLAVLAYAQIRDQLVNDRERSAQTRAFVNARLLRSSLGDQRDGLAAALDLDAGSARSRIVSLLNLDGQWYSGSVGLGSDAVPASLIDVVAANEVGQQRIVVDDTPYLVVGVPIAAKEARYYAFVPLDDIDDALDGLALRLAVVASATTVLGAATGWYASRRVIRPLREVGEASVGIADGALDRRLHTTDDPDLDPFVTSFNRMADAVQARIDREVRFTSDVSHEVRSPVAGMLASLSLARRRIQDPAALACLDDLEQRTQTFNQMVTDLLEISRAESGSALLIVEPLEPARLVGAALDALGMDVPVEAGPGTPAIVHGDRRRLGQVLMNLLTNAERYAGGATRIELGGDAEHLTIAVEDHGPGIPAHERSYVFERFARGTTAANVADGTGLGLALVVEHLKLHGATIRVVETPGGGARFEIELPVGRPDDEEER